MWQLCAAVAAMFLLVYWANEHDRPRYVCPMCGSANGDHHKDCSWKD
jgi:hypothetical protein